MGPRYDVQNQICSAQAFTGAATVSENAYKKQSAAQDISIGRRLAMLVFPTVDAGAGSTHVFEVIQADDAALTTNVEAIATHPDILAANLTTEDRIEIPIPQGSMTRQYLGIRNTATGGTTTVTVDCYLMPQDEIENYKSFPKVVQAQV